ncbi:uncharacterized protein [Eucyclogobius newberryi]|uniref:uncharacterized protein n=1 Tax=Eucyclogobius newberryi TaxID=166745 RepID=UPI003B58D02B
MRVLDATFICGNLDLPQLLRLVVHLAVALRGAVVSPDPGTVSSTHPEQKSSHCSTLRELAWERACTALGQVFFDENQPEGTEVTTITLSGNVNLQIKETEGKKDPFRLDLNKLVSTAVLDYDSMTPVGSVVGTYRAIDLDGDRLSYSLTSSLSGAFTLKSQTDPGIVVAKLLDFDKIKSVELTLTVQDLDPTHTNSTTIDITITDVDNRPPWFRPCTEIELQGVKICPNTGYSGVVSLGKMEDGPIALKPSPIWAVDGDNGLNYAIRYSLVGGPEDFFAIGPDTGNITLLKPVDVIKTFSMTVMASQVTNISQVATTSLIINVVVESLHKPQFERPVYQAVVKGVGTMAVDAADKVLRITALDQDYAAAGGINPNIVYTITGSNHFSIINGYVFMPTAAPEGINSLKVSTSPHKKLISFLQFDYKLNVIQVIAEDTLNLDTATADLNVEVLPVFTILLTEPTTTLPSTTITTSTAEPTSDPTSAASTAVTSDPTTIPSTIVTSGPLTSTTLKTTPGTSVQTSNPAPTTEGTTGSTAHPGGVTQITGGVTSGAMAALGASLGCLLFICIAVIAFLAVKIRKGDTAWKKINEASTFRSSLGPSGPKEGLQFTNEAFQHDDDDKDNKGGPSGGGQANGTVLSGMEMDKPQSRSVPRPPSPIQDEEKEVKPILTKDRAKEDGYKAVWFKEDIDPNAKEEVVIIPDSREEEDDDEDEGERKVPKVKFTDVDVDSGLGDKAEDSDEEVMSADL